MNEQQLWMQSVLVEKGYLTESGVTHRAAIRTHNKCRAACLAGISSDGFETWCDPVEIHAAGELLALLDGRLTFSLFAGRELCLRGHREIADYPAGAGERPAFAAHRCGVLVPAAWGVEREAKRVVLVAGLPF